MCPQPVFLLLITRPRRDSKGAEISSILFALYFFPPKGLRAVLPGRKINALLMRIASHATSDKL